MMSSLLLGLIGLISWYVDVDGDACAYIYVYIYLRQTLLFVCLLACLFACLRIIYLLYCLLQLVDSI